MLSPDEFSTQLDSYTARALPDTWLHSLYARRWFKLFLPAAYGGLALPLNQALEILFETAACQGSLGWVVNLGSGAGYFWPFMSPETATAVYGAPEAVIAGSDRAGCSLAPVAGGYRLRGRWPSCSGAAHATHFTLNAHLPDGQICSCVLPRAQVRLHDDWTAFGLRATSSWTVIVEGEHLFPNQLFQIGHLQQSDEDYPLTRIPFGRFARYCLLATLLGLGACLSSQVPDAQSMADWVSAQKQALQAQAQEAWANPQAPSKDPAFNRISQALYTRTCDLYYTGGLGLADETRLAHHAWRDLMVACQHGLLK